MLFYARREGKSCDFSIVRAERVIFGISIILIPEPTLSGIFLLFDTSVMFVLALRFA